METGLEIPLSQAGVADAPYSFEDRLIPYDQASFSCLHVLIPEIHDFILMKTVRAYEHDLDVIEEILQKNKVKKDILIERFDKEMNHVVGDKTKLKQNFAAVLYRCFGEEVADVLQTSLSDLRRLELHITTAKLWKAVLFFLESHSASMLKAAMAQTLVFKQKVALSCKELLSEATSEVIPRIQWDIPVSPRQGALRRLPQVKSRADFVRNLQAVPSM